MSIPPSLPVDYLPAEPASATPLSPARIESIDVLRGFAMLGILVVNVQSFAMIEAAYFNPTAYGDLSGANFWVWALTHVLADQKLMTIFGLLFGAGIVLMASGRERAGRSPAAAHYRRMVALLVIGLLHAYCLWYGDILVAYALCGMAAYPFRRLRPAVLLPLALALLAVPSLMFLAGAGSVRYWPPEAVAEFKADALPPPSAVAEELAIYRAGWLRQMDHRVPASAEFQTFVFATWSFWRAAGLMLAGVALFKLGVFSATRSRGFYAGLVVVGLLVGVPVVAYGAYRNFAAGWEPIYSFFIGTQYNYWASLIVSLGWIGLVMLACRAGDRFSPVTRPLAAVGRLALSNYLFQTLVCTTLFYGHGFGLFGKVQRIGQIGIVVAVWAVQIVLSSWYLRHFRIGPAEWVWRWVTNLQAPALRRKEQPAAAPAAALQSGG